MAKEATANPTTIYSVLAAGTRIVGSIDTEYDLRLDGTLEGDIICGGKLIMGLQSSMKGSIQCVNAEVMGKVEGNVDTHELLILRSQAVITGDVTASTLMIEPGAVLNGRCKMAVADNQE